MLSGLKLRSLLICGLIAGTLTAANLFFFGTEFGQSADYDIAKTLDFQVREKLGKAPTIDPIRRIFVTGCTIWAWCR